MNRRSFLQLSAASMASLAGSATATQAPPQPLRLSTSSLLFKELPLEQALKQIARLGFEAVDLWSGYEGCPHLDDALKRLGGDGLRERLQQHGLKLFAFSTYVGGYARYARLLGDAGGGIAVQGSAAPCEARDLSNRMRAFLETLKPLADLAGEQNSRLAIENHADALLDGTDSLQAFVDLNRDPRIGIALAPYHLQAQGHSVPKAIRVVGSQLLFFYAWQWGSGLQQLPGHGPADLNPWIEALRAADYRGYLNVFMHGHPDPATTLAAITRARDTLRTLIRP